MKKNAIESLWASKELSGLVLYQITQDGPYAWLHFATRESFDRKQEWLRHGETWHDVHDVCCCHLMVDLRTAKVIGQPHEMCQSMLTDKELAGEL